MGVDLLKKFSRLFSFSFYLGDSGFQRLFEAQSPAKLALRGCKKYQKQDDEEDVFGKTFLNAICEFYFRHIK
jgi:hypothetical protein